MEPGSDAAVTALAATPLATLIEHRQAVEKGKTLNEVHDVFDHEGPAYLGVVDGRQLIGISSRAVIGQVLGGRYGVALFGNHAIENWLLPHSLIVRASTPTSAALDLA